MKYYCKDCKIESKIEEKDLIPGRGWDIVNDEYLLFYVVCPNCKSINVFEECTSTDKELIPSDMKLRLMKKYAYVSDDYLDYYKSLREYERTKKKCESIMEKIKYKQELFGDDSRLYDNWKDSEEIVEGVSKLQLK